MMRLYFYILFSFFIKCYGLKPTATYTSTGLYTTRGNTYNIVADGNSYFVQGGPTIFATITGAYPLGTFGYNFAVSGQDTEQMIADCSSEVLPTYHISNKNVIIFQEGGNDLYRYCNVDTAILNVERYCTLAHNAGFKIIVSTLIHRDNASVCGDDATQYNIKVDAFNASLIALIGTGAFDGCIRPDLESIFATYTSGGYNADHIHPNQTGFDKYSTLYITAINALTW